MGPLQSVLPASVVVQAVYAFLLLPPGPTGHSCQHRVELSTIKQAEVGKHHAALVAPYTVREQRGLYVPRFSSGFRLPFHQNVAELMCFTTSSDEERG